MANEAAPLRRLVYEVLEEAAGGHPIARAVTTGLLVLILVNVTAVVLESIPEWRAVHEPVFLTIEIVSVIVFTVEYLLRLWSSVEHPPFRGLSPAMARLRHALHPMALVDLLAILPFYLSFVFEQDLRVLLAFRLLRFFKLARYSPGLTSLMDAVRSERHALIACAVIQFGAVLTTATVMHLVEHKAQPAAFGSIPSAMWWAVVTLSTVGYGDVVPVTTLGKVVGAFTMMLGLVMLGLPVGIIASAFAREIQRHEFVVTWAMVARVPLFSDLGAASIAAIMRYLRSQSAQAGETLVRRGDRAHSMYFIAAGEVEAEFPGERKRLGPGQFFGEIAVIEDAERAATVRAITPVRLLVLDAIDLKIVMDSDADIATRIHAIARRRVEPERIAPHADIAAEELTGGDMAGDGTGATR
ncbi:MAG: cyclic nucleotide-gated ion channel [Labrys sp. (in: a-proteobacteria)]